MLSKEVEVTVNLASNLNEVLGETIVRINVSTDYGETENLSIYYRFFSYNM